MTKVLLSTIDDRELADQLAARLVQERLAACVNIIPNISSVYKWKGEVEHATECLMLVKTSSERVGAAIRRIKELHSYELPEVIVLPIERGLEAYLDWIVSETRLEE